MSHNNNTQTEKVYLCSGFMLNCCFETTHNDPADIFIMTSKGFEKIGNANEIARKLD